jgi:hypothetical protein
MVEKWLSPTEEIEIPALPSGRKLCFTNPHFASKCGKHEIRKTQARKKPNCLKARNQKQRQLFAL